MSSTGRATSRLIASIDWRGRGAFLGVQQLQRVQGGGDLAAEDLGELQVLLGEGVGPRAFDVEGADDLVLIRSAARSASCARRGCLRGRADRRPVSGQR